MWGVMEVGVSNRSEHLFPFKLFFLVASLDLEDLIFLYLLCFWVFGGGL